MSKPALKSIKAAIDANDYSTASDEAAKLLQQDGDNYTGLVFLGFARDKLDDDSGAEKAYLKAATVKPNDLQALKGLITLCEKNGQTYLDRYHATVAQLAQVFAALDDPMQCQGVVDKYELFARKYGSRKQYRNALELMLPSSSVYAFLEGRLPHPSQTLSRMIGSMELEEKEWVNTQIGERRTRLGAKVDQVVLDVKREAFARYPLENLYQEAIDWTNDDEARRGFEEKLLQRAYDTLLALPQAEKARKRDQVLNLANGMVIVKHAYELAWTIAIEWVDAESMAEWDVGVFQDFLEFFPNAGMSKVLRGWLDSDASPFAGTHRDTSSKEPDREVEMQLSEADRLILMVEGLDRCQNSLLAHRIMADTYLALAEYKSAVEIARKAQLLHTQAIQNFGLALQNGLDSVNIMLADALTMFQSPRYHPEALQLFEEILDRRPVATAALSGVGLILEEQEDFDQAVSFLTRALTRDPSNLRIKAELAWCRALSKDMMPIGLAELEHTLGLINEARPINLGMKAETLYRVGFCQWQLNDQLYPRAQRDGPYRYFLDSIKANPSFAPAYTMLGIFFDDYGKSRRRARTAFQKAFELSPGEIEAAYRLARLFAENGEWDLVELVAARVVESGKAIPAPGSKRKAHSWPFAALGVVEINKQNYSRSIAHLQKALRVVPQDYHAWINLGESYHNCGRHIAAERAFSQAERFQESLPRDQTWFAEVMLASVRRAVGAYDQAIQGYEAALALNQDDSGVALSLLQTYTESAATSLEAGRSYVASVRAVKALEIADRIAVTKLDTFSLWKAVADACSTLASAPIHAQTIEAPSLEVLLGRIVLPQELGELLDADGIQLSTLQSASQDGNAKDKRSITEAYLIGGILASKRAILAASQDTHAQAVSWYNLGWMEHRLSSSGALVMLREKGRRRKCSKTAMRCFKQAIELEASNAEFWNSFAISIMRIHPTISQHAFVRSLHLNDKSARVWTNLGAFYMVHNDHQLANDAFTRGQSADPEYALAWLGQGLLAILVGDHREAVKLFTHAFDVSDSFSTMVKQQYTRATFDHIADDNSLAPDVASLGQPLFALRQLHSQTPHDIAVNHLSALFTERVGSFDESKEWLQGVCAAAEDDYERSESVEALSQFLQAKSDLARAQFAQHEYREAVENAQIVLDLSSQDDSASLQAQPLQKWRLSAHLTSGLAYHFLGETGSAVERIQKAVEETNEGPDTICILAQTLWSNDQSDERTMVQGQLFDCVEQHPEHVGAVTLLGVIAILDGDQDAIEAVEVDLQAMLLHDKLDVDEREKVLKVLASISVVRASENDRVEEATVHEAMKEIMLSPGKPHGWADLNAISQNTYAAEMALLNSARNVPPVGDLNAEALSIAYAQTGRRSDALQGIMTAPWKHNGWDSLADSLLL